MSHTNVVYNLVKLITSSGAWFLVARPVCGVIHLLLSRTVESQSQVLHNHAITNRNTDTYVVTKYDWLNIRVFIVTRLEHRIPEHQPTKQPIYPPSQPTSQLVTRSGCWHKIKPIKRDSKDWWGGMGFNAKSYDVFTAHVKIYRQT